MTSVTVLVPAFNEGIALGANLVRLADYFSLYGDRFSFEYVIVDDGSTDDTLAVARTFARFRENVTVLAHTQNSGLGRSLRTGFSVAKGEYVLALDADMSYSADLAIELLETMEAQQADIVMASPYMKGGSVVNVPFMRRVLSREANRFLSLATNGRFATLTAMVRVYRTAFVKQLNAESPGMEINPEIVFAALRSGGKVVEVPARLQWSEERRTSPARTNVKKILNQSLAVARTGFAYRPSLWLAIPGLFPGLLPLVVAILLMLHVPARTLALGAAVTVTIQYTSLAIFAGQLTSFFAHAVVAGRTSRVKVVQ
ncbi:MAG TPA: glycosyltransferase family 2 protein [Candidatus Baltobacteraceae bacterium]|jgi:glycosyltransferase involved in cell wall biosynthesis|nr:glycosyltransferase family 2 protein [Candidatus Baltobacteraceae bacterium]